MAGSSDDDLQAQIDAVVRLVDANRRRIDAAIGMLMASRNMTEEQAFAVLRTASQNSNRKLRVLAAELVTTSSGSGRGLEDDLDR
jgi:AmiR/NasT family two-component response regulator